MMWWQKQSKLIIIAAWLIISVSLAIGLTNWHQADDAILTDFNPGQLIAGPFYDLGHIVLKTVTLSQDQISLHYYKATVGRDYVKNQMNLFLTLAVDTSQTWLGFSAQGINFVLDQLP